MDSNYSLADIAAATGGGRNDGFCGDGNGWWIIILFLAIFCGWGGNGWGANGANGTNGAGFQGWATRADVNEGFALNNLQAGVTAIQRGICDSTYALNNAIQTGFSTNQVHLCNGFNQVQQGFNSLGAQLAQCCCDTQRAIDGVNYNMATQSCDTRNTIQSTTRDIIDNQNANSRAILDFLTQEKLDSLRTELTQAQAQLAQANQTNNLINALRPCPTPAYLTCNPWAAQAPYGSCGSCNC